MPRGMTPEELRFPVAWGHVAAKAWGSPSDDRVLLVHGTLDNAGSFDRLISLLPQKYYFVCIDLPGHGLSSHFPAELPLDYMNYVLVIRRVLDSLKWPNCLYIGHSLGASLGVIFASLYPNRVQRILCLDATVVKPISDHRLVSRICEVYDIALRSKEEERAAKLYSEDEVMYMLTNLRFNTLNNSAAKALMTRSVTKVGEKYKFNRDKRLAMGLYPLLNPQQYSTILTNFETPATVVFATATLSKYHYKDTMELHAKLQVFSNLRSFVVEGNHDVHNNHPERVAPYARQFLANLNSHL